MNMNQLKGSEKFDYRNQKISAKNFLIFFKFHVSTYFIVTPHCHRTFTNKFKKKEIALVKI